MTSISPKALSAAKSAIGKPNFVDTAVRAEISGHVRKVFDFLCTREPVAIETLFAAVNSTPGIYDRKQMQQRLGGTITLLNRKLAPHGLRAVPGEPRGTYRIRETLQ